MLPVYFQGSVIGALMGLIVIITLGTWLIRSKTEVLSWFTKKYRWLVTVAVLVAWSGSFVNVGIHQTPGDRASFDQVGKLVDKDIPAVHKTSATPASVRADTAKTREEIDAGNLQK